jgi:hypothetical protein
MSQENRMSKFSLSPAGGFCTALQIDVRIFVQVSLSLGTCYTQDTQLHSEACTRFILFVAPDGRLSKPVSLCLWLLRLKAYLLLRQRVVINCMLSDSKCFREIVLFTCVKKLCFYQRFGMNQLKCKSELKCKWEFAVFLIIAFPYAVYPSLSLFLASAFCLRHVHSAKFDVG